VDDHEQTNNWEVIEFDDLAAETANSVAKLGREAYARRTTIAVKSLSCLESKIPKRPGVYWIETDMPVERLQDAIKDATGKARRTRKKAPKGTKLLLQNGAVHYVAYSGTEKDLQVRLSQHLFNLGNTGTVKLGCLVDQSPFNQYEWKVSFTVIEQYVLRYAVEAWWRLELGWPVFCLR
jgi:hypothetical protein